MDPNEVIAMVESVKKLDKFIESVSSGDNTDMNCIGSITLSPIHEEGNKQRDATLTDLYKYTETPSEWFWESNERRNYGWTGERGLIEGILKAIDHLDKVPAPFGNLSKKETQINPEIRDCFQVDISEEIKQKYIFKDLCAEIAKKWLKMTGHLVDVIPDKVLFYPIGGHFKEHVDTPKPGLLGTVILHLQGEYDVFRVNGKTWTSECGDFCSFFSDSPHEILPTQKERIVATFKIYSKAREIIGKPLNTVKFMERFAGRKQFGILLKHGYTGSDMNLKGIDQMLLQTVQSLGYDTELIPVLVQCNSCMSYRKEGRQLVIYAFQTEHPTMTFFINGYTETHCKSVPAEFYIGNEYSDGQENYYLNKALICTRKD